MSRVSTWLFFRTAAPHARRALGAAGLLGALAPSTRAAAQPVFPSASLCDATPGNLVQNCGFEAGAPTGWTFSTPLGSGLSIAGLATSAHTGRYYLRFTNLFQNSPSASVLEQLATTPGAQYTFSFYLVSNAIGGEPPSTGAFRAFWGGQQVFDLLGQGPNFDVGYRQYSFVATAPTGLTEVRFEAFNSAAAYYLDDVSVTPAAVPEPATVALVGGGAAALGVLARRRRRG